MIVMKRNSITFHPGRLLIHICIFIIILILIVFSFIDLYVCMFIAPALHFQRRCPCIDFANQIHRHVGALVVIFYKRLYATILLETTPYLL